MLNETATYFFYMLIMVVSVVGLKLYSSKRLSGDDNGKRSLRLILLVASFLALLIPLILRDISVGTDYVVYRDVFETIVKNGADERVVAWLGLPFIYLIQYVAPLISDNYVIFYSFLSFLSLMFLYASVLRSKNPWLSLLLFICFCLYFQMFNQMRQLLAICILLYSVRYAISRELAKFLLLVGLAAVFHTTAVLFLPVYIFAKSKITRRNLLLYLFIGIALAISFTSILSIIALTNYGAVYLNTSYDRTFLLNTIQNFVVRLILLVLCLAYAKRTIAKYPEAIYYYNIVIYCTLLQILTIYSSLFGRLTTMFFVAYIILIPLIIRANFYKALVYRRVLFAMIVGALIYQYVYYNSANGAIGSGYNEYRLINSGEK